MVVHKERINERGSCIFVKWSYTNKRNKPTRELILVEWSCTKESINERGPYIFVSNGRVQIK